MRARSTGRVSQQLTSIAPWPPRSYIHRIFHMRTSLPLHRLGVPGSNLWPNPVKTLARKRGARRVEDASRVVRLIGTTRHCQILRNIALPWLPLSLHQLVLRRWLINGVRYPRVPSWLDLTAEEHQASVICSSCSF